MSPPTSIACLWRSSRRATGPPSSAEGDSGGPYAWLPGVRDVDEELLERLGRGFMETDELGGRLAQGHAPATGRPIRSA